MLPFYDIVSKIQQNFVISTLARSGYDNRGCLECHLAHNLSFLIDLNQCRYVLINSDTSPLLIIYIIFFDIFRHGSFLTPSMTGRSSHISLNWK